MWAVWQDVHTSMRTRVAACLQDSRSNIFVCHTRGLASQTVPSTYMPLEFASAAISDTPHQLPGFWKRCGRLLASLYSDSVLSSRLDDHGTKHYSKRFPL